ncbi:unnamed protein product, partial [Rhizoctonia solani]
GDREDGSLTWISAGAGGAANKGNAKTKAKTTRSHPRDFVASADELN